jgi:integrase
MAVVPRKLANGKFAYWVTFQWKGEPVWKRIGFDKAEAKRLDALWRKQRKEGTYRDERPSEFIKVGAWFERYLEMRTNRSVETDRQQLTDHALSIAWFAELRVIDVQPPDIERLIQEIRKAGNIGEKSIVNLFSVLQSGFKRAIFEQIRSTNPCATLPRGTLRRGVGKKREPYLRQEARALMLTEHSELMRLFLTMAFYTGMRLGEIAGRRFRDWLTHEPLTCLRVHTQYDDQPLKTDDEEMVRPRWIPVHRELEQALQAWWGSGFELHTLRQPTPDDFIFPTRSNQPHAKNSVWEKFQLVLAGSDGVPNRTIHSTRHTFATVCRAGTVRHDLVERITHNASGTTLDDYTHPEWEALCEVVMGTDYSLDRVSGPGGFAGDSPGHRPVVSQQELAVNHGKQQKDSPASGPQKARTKRGAAVNLDGSQDPRRARGRELGPVIDSAGRFDAADPGWFGPKPPPETEGDFGFLAPGLTGGER